MFETQLSVLFTDSINALLYKSVFIFTRHLLLLHQELVV